MGLLDRLLGKKKAPESAPSAPSPGSAMNPNLTPFLPKENSDQSAPVHAPLLPPVQLEPETPATSPSTDVEPTIQLLSPTQTLPGGVHIDSEPTVEFRLPSSAEVIPLRERPTDEMLRLDTTPRSPMRKLTASRERWIKPETGKPTRGPVTNVLVVDLEKCSCYLVKSILLGHRFGVSISTTLEDASAKMATGLFDIVFADVGEGTGAEVEFIQGLNLEMPALPVIALCREEAQALAGCVLSARLRKPIRMAQVHEAARIAAFQMEKAGPESRRKAAARLKVHVESPSGPTLDCLLTSVSLSGLMLESAGTAYAELQSFQDFFVGLDRKPVRVDIDVEGRPRMQITARHAFAETTPDHKIRQVGLSIWPAEAEVAALKGIIAHVA